jgi:hypothetical protein
MGKGDENDPSDIRLQTSVEEIGEPARVGIRKELLRARRKEHASEVNHHIDPLHRSFEGLRTREVGTNRGHVPGLLQTVLQRSPMHHQAQVVTG